MKSVINLRLLFGGAVLCNVLLFGLASGAQAQEEEQPDILDRDVLDSEADPGGFWNVSSILEMAVDNLGRRYNLNDTQKAYTNNMMQTRVTRFIRDHQDEVWPILRSLLLHQQQGTLPDQETAKRMGPRVLKLMHEAKKEIYESNDEWHEILTEDQKRMHKWDLKEMDKTFETMEANFESWVEGNPKSGGIFPNNRRGKGPSRPPAPTSSGTLHEDPKKDQNLDAGFDEFVKEFVKDFDLQPDQIETAHSILREVKHRAVDFRRTSAKKIKELKDKLAAARTVKERRKWNQQRQKTMKPVRDLFTEMTERLDQIPSAVQRERFELKSKLSASAIRKISSFKRSRRSKPVGHDSDSTSDDSEE